MTKMPEHVKVLIRQHVYAMADEENYLDSNRTDNAALLERMCNDREIGGVLRQYLSREKIRTYIKDAVLNRYAKERKASLRPTFGQCADFCARRFSVSDFNLVATEGKDLVLFKSVAAPLYAVVVYGTCLKWETALRKALLFVASKPFGAKPQNTVKIVLSLCQRGTSLTPADYCVLEKALAHAGASAYLWGECGAGKVEDESVQINGDSLDFVEAAESPGVYQP